MSFYGSVVKRYDKKAFFDFIEFEVKNVQINFNYTEIAC